MHADANSLLYCVSAGRARLVFVSKEKILLMGQSTYLFSML